MRRWKRYDRSSEEAVLMSICGERQAQYNDAFWLTLYVFITALMLVAAFAFLMLTT